MRPVTSVKGQTLLSAMSTTILNIMDSQKLLLISMLISVQDKTKTTILCGSRLGGLYYSFIIRLDTLFWLQDTPSLAPIVVLVLSKKSCKLSYISSLYEFANTVELSSSAINKHSLWGHNSYRPSIWLVLISWRVLLISPFLILQRRTWNDLFERAQLICWTVVNAVAESCNPFPHHVASSQTESSRVEPRTKVVFVLWNEAFL